MGLLDDAIREHLELKRRRGADPGEIAQQERAALETTYADDAPAGVGLEERDAEAFDELAAAADEPAMPAPVDDAPPQGDPLAGHAPTAAQETAELDMAQVLEHDGYEPPHGDPLGQEALGGGSEAEGPADDSLEWDFPGEPSSEPPPEEIPGQERLTFE